MTRRGLTSLGIAGAIALLIAVGLAIGMRRPAETPSAPGAPPVTLATVRSGTVDDTVALTGRVGPPAGTQSKLAFAVAGTVQSIDVSLGQHVSAGTALAQLDATPYTLAAAQAASEASAASQGAALAAVDRTSLKVHQDEVELGRQERLYQAGIVALRDVEAARAALWADRGEARSARIALSQARDQSSAASLHSANTRYDVERTTLRAPNDATVVGILVSAGQTVDPTVAAIALASDRQGIATLNVSAAELARIASGQLVHGRSADGSWQGRITSIAPAVDPATGMAIAIVAGIPLSTPAGTPVDASVVVRRIRGLVVPRDAVIEDPQTGADLVFVATAGKNGATIFSARRVSVDARDGRYARVASGLNPGERVASQGAIDLLSQPGD